MFGISLPELLLILAIALVIMGPADLVHLCSSAGRKVRQAREAVSALRRSAEECERVILDEASSTAREASSTASAAARAAGLPGLQDKGR